MTKGTDQKDMKHKYTPIKNEHDDSYSAAASTHSGDAGLPRLGAPPLPPREARLPGIEPLTINACPQNLNQKL